MHRLPLLLALYLVAALAANADEEREFIISGYWPEFRTWYDINATAVHMTDLMLHSVNPTADGGISDCCIEEKNYVMAQQARSYKKEMTGKDLRIWIAVGGWGRSKQFDSIVYDGAAKKRLLLELKEMCEKYDIGGVDFDWQEPVSQEDTMGFYRLLRTAKATLGKSGIKIGVALQRGRQLPTKMYQYVDRVHLLAYEMDLMKEVYHADIDKVKSVAKSFVAGCPPEKLTIGLPLYSRVTDKPGQMRTIAEMVTEQAEGKVEDILNSESEYNGFVYDTPKAIAKKVRLALDMGLGGIHFWEVGQDYIDNKYGPGGIILQAVLNEKGQYFESEKSENEL